MRCLLTLIGVLVSALMAASCSGGPSADDDLYARLFEVDADPTMDSLNGVYMVVSATEEGRLYVHSIDEQSKLRVAIDDTSFHLSARCLDGVIIGATVDAELETGPPDHLLFSGEDVASRQEASGIRCRVSLGEGLWGGRAPIDLDGLTLVIESGDDPTSNLELRKISDWPEGA